MKTEIYKGAYGWTAETTTDKLLFTTMKRYNRAITTTKRECKLSWNNGVRLAESPEGSTVEYGKFTTHGKATKKEIERIHYLNLREWGVELSTLELTSAGMSGAIAEQDKLSGAGEVVRII